MKIKLRRGAITPDQQKKNDTHQPRVVVLFFLVIAIFFYMFTNISEPLHLPTPKDLFEKQMGLTLHKVFDSDGNIDSWLYVMKAKPYGGSNKAFILFTIISGAFLCGYFLPLEKKRASFVLWFLIGLLVLYGFHVTCSFLTAHLAIYLLFHTSSRDKGIVSAIFGFLLTFVLLDNIYTSVGITILLCACAGLASQFTYRYLLVSCLEKLPRVASILQTLAIQAPLILGFGFAIRHGLTGDYLVFTTGVILFMIQFERLLMYHVDYKDGEVPKDLSVFGYLSVFCSPAVLPNHTWSPSIGQGYSYLNNNYLCEDKNKLVIAGLKIWLIAFVYLMFGHWLIRQFIGFMDECCSITAYRTTTQLVRSYVSGTPITTSTVLISTFIDQSWIFLIAGGVTHFKVGTWRVLGYNMDPYYNKPWLATNMVSLWGRFAFHYREFLVRVFYYPVFLRFFKKRLLMRVFVATMAATFIGNFIWGHLAPRLYEKGPDWYSGILKLRTWPYFLLLGLSISLTQVYLLKRKQTRKPWTRDSRFIVDIFKAYFTFQFFSLIHIFARPTSGSDLWDHFCLFVKGFGVHL